MLDFIIYTFCFLVEISALQEQGVRFAVALEEWTSVRHRRYISVNVRNGMTSWNLGLIRLDGDCEAAVIVGLITAKLDEFGIFLEPNVIAITIDGTAVMQKVQKTVFF